MWGYAPHTRTREFLPWTRYTILLDLRNQRVSVWSWGTMWGYAPHTPHQGGPPWTRYTMGLGFKKSAFFCVEQKKRMSCSIPRQRLSVRSGPGQPVDRGFSDDRYRESLLSRMRFIPKTAPCRGEQGHNSRNPMFHAETFCTTRQLSSRNGGAGESFPCFGVWGRRAPKDFPARRPP